MGLLLGDERAAVAEYGRKLIERGLTRGTGGNVSIFNRKKQLFAVSPSGMDYFEIRPEDVVVMSVDGKITDGARRPSSEADMHRLIYMERDDVNAVVHTHSVFASALSCTVEGQRNGLPPVHCLAALAGGDVRCVPYRPFGTMELALAARDGIRGRRAVLLGNHGLLTVGNGMEQAFAVAEEIEFVCELYARAVAMGTPALLSAADMEDAIERFKGYGQR